MISPISILLGYGLYIILFAYQIFLPIKKSLLKIFLTTWVAVSLGLALLPYGLSRLYLSGLIFPMGILFLLCVDDISNHLKIQKYWTMIIVLLLFLLTSLFIFNKRISEVKGKNIWFYIPESFQQGLDFLEKSRQDGVLALPPLSSYIPTKTGKRVYFGLKDQTPDYDNKLNNAVMFYEGKLSENKAKAFLKGNNIHYIVVASDDQLHKLSYLFLTVVYRNQKIEILSR